MNDTIKIDETARLERTSSIRALAMDAVQLANSGHPGMPMGMADIAEILWREFLNHDPKDPNWPDRDRFVLSNGHGSMLIYALLHLTGYDLPLDEIKSFRKLGSKTPGHPEFGITPGVEVTTGPLAQGFSSAVGMALAEKRLATQFNRDDCTIVNHHTYVFLGDGCLMEGLSHEAASFAAYHQLGKLIAIYDENKISLDGEISGWFLDNTPARFRAYGWHVVENVDGHNPDQVRSAIRTAQKQDGRPSLICCNTVIGYGSPNKQGTAQVHGSPLGEVEVSFVREVLDWKHPPFVIPQSVYDSFSCVSKGAMAHERWNEKLDFYCQKYPKLAGEFKRRIGGKLPDNWKQTTDEFIRSVNRSNINAATRESSQMVLEFFGPRLPELIGGSADLTNSNLVFWSKSKPLNRDNPDGNYIYFGVREFGMTSIVNGLSLHGGFIPYGATFLVFSEYARNAVRMAAIMGIRSIFVYTHDSIGLGEDGPTHQAVEQAATLRLIPNMSVWRPCDATETAVAWKAAIERKDGPTCLLLTRQTVPANEIACDRLPSIEKGGYVIAESDEGMDAIIIATGSEVQLAINAMKSLAEKNIHCRVVSLPSVDVFESQNQEYQNSVIPPHMNRRVIVEAGVSALWHKYAGPSGITLGVDRFGESAPPEDVFRHFNLTAEAVEKAVLDLYSCSQ